MNTSNNFEEREKHINMLKKLNNTKLYSLTDSEGIAGYYEYAPIVWDVFSEIKNKYKDCVNYKNHLAQKTPEQMSKQDIVEQFIFWLRGERFCDGAIASAIDEGYFVLLFALLFDLK